MAYVKQDDEEQQGGQPSLAPGNGGGAIAGSGGGTGYTAPVQRSASSPESPQQQAGSGTGFTNLSSWLDAGKGRDQNITNRGNQTLSGVRNDFNAAAQPLMSATFNPTTLGLGDANDLLNTASGGGAGAGGAMQKLKDSLGQKYTGPMSIDYDLSQNNKQLSKLGQLGSADTAGAQLAGSQQYGAGDRRMDSVLFGADAASQNAMGDLNKQTGDFTKLAGSAEDAGAKKAAGFVDAANTANTANTGTLGKIGDSLLGGLDAQVQGRTKKEQQDQLTGTVRDPNTGQVVGTPSGYTSAGWQAGTGATEGNTVTAPESAKFQALRSLLGNDKYNVTQSGQPYRSGYNAVQLDPDKAGMLNVNPGLTAASQGDQKASQDAIASLSNRSMIDHGNTSPAPAWQQRMFGMITQDPFDQAKRKKGG